MLLINKLKNIENFSEIENKLADYVLSNYKNIVNMTIDEFSSENYVSNSTIVRFSQKLGFKGFSDFKITLVSEINTFTKSDKRVEVDVPFTKEDSFQDLPNIFLNLHHQSITDIYSHIDMNQVERLAKKLHEAQLISLWAQGPSLLLALDFHYKLKRLGYPLTVEELNGFDHIPIVKRSENEIAVIITTYGSSENIKYWLKHHKKVGNETIIICLNPNSPFIKFADNKIILDTFEKRLMKLGHFTSKTTMGYILDILYSSIFKLDYDTHIETLKLSEQVANKVDI